MITKRDVVCINSLKKGPFFREYVVTFNFQEKNSRLFKLRAMSKKQIVKNKEDEKMVMDELYIRSNLRNHFIINQMCAFQDYDNLFYITECAPVFLLDKKIFPSTFSINAIKFYASEILLGLLYFHSKHQVYTFLFPGNICIGLDGHIKLDFAFCNGLNESPNDIYTYLEYMSPTYLLKHEFNFDSDFWSLGIVLFQMAVGYTPFGSESTDATAYAMLKREIHYPDWLDPDLVSLIDLLLSEGIFSDNVAENARLLKRHPFFSNIDWKRVEEKRTIPPYKMSFNCPATTNLPTLSVLYTSDYIFGEKDGYGDTFASYNTIAFMKS